MGLFDQFPYTNFHNLNLDWIISQIKNIKTAVTSTAEDAASASESAEAAAASAGSAAESAETAGTAAALVDQVREDLDTVNTEMTNFVQAHSGLYNETVLWTGTASAQGDTIELSDDIRNYKYIDVQATYKGATSSSSSLGVFPSNVVRFTPEVFTEDNAVLNIPYAYEDQLQICTVFMFWDSLDPTDYTKISLGYTRRVSINDHGNLDNAADPGTVIVKILGVKNIADAEVIDARVGEDDTVYPTLKQRLDAEYSELNSAITDIEEQIDGDGLTPAIKSALVQLAQKVTYIDSGGPQYYQDLYNALYPPVVYTDITLNTNSLAFGVLNTTQTLVATTTPAGGSVTWSSSNTSIATVSQTGVVTSVGYGNATITATCGNLSATCSVSVAQATVTSISAVFNQVGVTVYDTDSLDSLKAHLTVRATWSDSTTTTVPDPDYTLSGTLTVGISTITVSYGGKTATFNVTVTGQKWTYNISDLTRVTGPCATNTNSTCQMSINQNGSSDLQRRSFMLDTGETVVPVRPDNSTYDYEHGFYPIKVPAGATQFTVSITPSTQFVQVLARQLNAGVYSTYSTVGPSGYNAGSVTKTMEAAGDNVYIFVSTKYNDAGTSYPTEPTGLDVVFE